MHQSARIRPRPFRSAFVALISALTLVASLGLTVNASDNKPYTATWLSGSSPVANPPNSIAVSGGTATAVLQLKNLADPQSLGSANITAPAAYTLTGGSLGSGSGTATRAGNTLQLRNLSLAPNATVNITLNFKTPCVDGTARTWAIIVKQANNFSGPPGNDFVRATGTAAPVTTAAASACLLRFANQPAATHTGSTITDAFDSSGSGIRVEIYDPVSGLTVDTDAPVSLALGFNTAGGTLSGGAATNAVAGVATFSALSINKPGPYTLKASSPAASNNPETGKFMVADNLDTCDGVGCSFAQQGQGSSLTVTPKNGVAGAGFANSFNLGAVKISCDFSPYNYPDARQPNAIWYDYDDGGANSVKTNVLVIDKAVVQITPENGSSKYRICYASNVPFTDRNGNPAPQDPWGPQGPSAFFGETWYMGLLPDCGKKPVAPCSQGFTGQGSGDRVGTFLTPGGDPFIR
jgi:hypothetical protein